MNLRSFYSDPKYPDSSDSDTKYPLLPLILYKDTEVLEIIQAPPDFLIEATMLNDDGDVYSSTYQKIPVVVHPGSDKSYSQWD